MELLGALWKIQCVWPLHTLPQPVQSVSPICTCTPWSQLRWVSCYSFIFIYAQYLDEFSIGLWWDSAVCDCERGLLGFSVLVYLDFIVTLWVCAGVCAGVREGVSRVYQGCIMVLRVCKGRTQIIISGN